MKYRRENIWGFAFIVLAGGVLLCFATYTIHTRYVEAALKAPFNISDIRESAGIEDTEKFSCERPSTPMNDLKLEAFKDSIPENKTSATRFENQVTLMANRYVQSNPARTDVSDCVVEWLVSWAKQDALLSYADNTGQQIRTSVLASAALAYLQIRNEKTFKEEDAKVIRQWLHDLSTNVIKDFSENTDLITSHNNHLYWMIWSVAVTAIALDDPITQLR